MYRIRLMCGECHEVLDTYVGSNDHSQFICGPCQKEIEDIKHSDYFAKLDLLSPEERLLRTEEWIYAHSGVQHGYIEAPRY